MKKIITTSVFLLLGIFLYAQSPVGIWKNVDDKTGEAKAHIKIYKTNDGTLQGKIVKLLQPDADKYCTECEGDRKDKPILGMVIMWGMEKDGDEWEDGKILDPENGKIYGCQISLKDENTLKVRGYIGFSLLGRTQIWYRVE